MDMYVYIVVMQSEDDEDGVYAFTNKAKAVQFVKDEVVRLHEGLGEPSRKIEEVAEDAERQLEHTESYDDETTGVYYYIKCPLVE